MINSPRKTKKHLFALCPLFQRHKRELPPTVQGFLNWPAARWQLGKIRFTTQLFHSQEETNMEIFSVATALFQFLASLMSLLSRFPLMG